MAHQAPTSKALQQSIRCPGEGFTGAGFGAQVASSAAAAGITGGSARAFKLLLKWPVVHSHQGVCTSSILFLSARGTPHATIPYAT